jgi:hypothetical protein
MGYYLGVECQGLRRGQQEQPVRPMRHLLAWSLLRLELGLQERPARPLVRPERPKPQPFLLLALQEQPSVLPSA